MAWIPKANLRGPQGAIGDRGVQGLPGVNATPADAAVAGYISTGGTSATRSAVEARITSALAGFIANNKLTVYGHSYTPVPGYYVTPYTGEWSSKLAAKLGITRLSQGASGARMIEAAAMAIGTGISGASGNRSYAPGQAGVVAIECDINDALSGPATTAGRLGFGHALRAFLATVTAAQRIEASSATETGTWSTVASDYMSDGSARYTDEDLATMTFSNVSAPSGKVHILTLANQASVSPTGTLTVAVDGTDQGISYIGEGQMEGFISSMSGNPGRPSYSPAVITLSVPAAGTHTIKITKKGVIRNIYVDALLIPGATPPPVLVLKDPPVGNLTTPANQAAYAANSGPLRTIIDSVAAEFPSATVVDLSPGWNPATMVSTEDTKLFHPNEVGMQHIADKVEKPLVDVLLTRLATTMWAPGDTGWVNVAINPGFAQQGPQAPRVRRVNGQVFFDWGFASTGLVAGTAQIVGVIPVGFRPVGGSAYINAVSNTASTGSGARFELQPNGNVSLLVPATLGTYYLAASGSSYFI